MNALHSPSFALRPQRDGLRHKQFSFSRPRAAGLGPAHGGADHGAGPDCVFKRMPAIGDTCAQSGKQRW